MQYTIQSPKTKAIHKRNTQRILIVRSSIKWWLDWSNIQSIDLPIVSTAVNCPSKWSLYWHWGICIDHLYISHIRSQRNIVQQCTTPQLSSKQSWWCATCYTWTTDDHFEEILCAILTNGLPSSWDPIQNSRFIKFEIIPLCVECLVVLESDLEGWQ